MNYVVVMASCGVIYRPSFMKIGTGVQAILRFCLRSVRGCNVGITWYYQREGFMNYAVDMGSGALIYIPNFIKIGSAIQKLMVGGTHIDSKVMS
jgi:hypothetical protein